MVTNTRKTIQKIVIASALAVALVFLFLNFNKIRFWAEEINNGNTQIDQNSLTTNWQDYANQGSTATDIKVPKYEKFELTFDINWYKNGQFSDPNSKYNPLTAEWSDGAVYRAGNFIRFNDNIYKTKIDVPGKWYKYGLEYEPDTVVIYQNKAYKSIKNTPVNWIAGTTYNLNDRIRNDNDLIFEYKYPTSSEATANNKPGSQGGGAYWQKVGDGNMVILEPDYASSEYWQEQIAYNIDTKPETGNWQEYWEDTGQKYVNPYWPYEESPASNTPENIASRGDGKEPVPSKVGISVDGIFSNDNWQTEKTQPGFYYQDYDYDKTKIAGQSWLYPKGNPVWKVRFTAPTNGNWKYKIRVTDRSGTSYTSDQNTFLALNEVKNTENHGFVRVSADDSRYFVGDDNKYLNFVGLNDDTKDPAEMDSIYAGMVNQGINLIRPWWQGSQGPVVFGGSGQGCFFGYNPMCLNYGVNENAKPGELFSENEMGISHTGNISVTAQVKNNSRYRISTQIKTSALSGTGDYGIALKTDGGVNGNFFGAPLTQKLSGDTDWTELSAVVSTFDTYNFLNSINLRPKLYDTIDGNAYLTDFSVREVLEDNTLGPELLAKPDFNSYKYISQVEAWKADYQVNLTRQDNIYLKIVLGEKQDRVFSGINPNGTATKSRSEDLFLANPTSANRVYQTYMWRYAIARYGYATNIHSFEYMNEGNPSDGNHGNALEAFAQYFNNNDINKHLTTTSVWSPNAGSSSIVGYDFINLWSKFNPPSYSYVDLHQYVGQTTGTRWQYVFGWQAGETNSLQVCNSAPRCVEIIATGTTDLVGTTSQQIPIIPGHTYTVKAKLKGENVVLNANSTKPPSVRLWLEETFGGVQTTTNMISQGTFSGTYAWTDWQSSFTAGPNDHYALFSPMSYEMLTGTVYFDDFSISDNADGKDFFPNGNFDSERIDYDSALTNYSLGTMIGNNTTKMIKKPLIRGEVGYSDPTNPILENPLLVNDTNLIWFKKLIWSQINSFGIIDMYWWTNNIRGKTITYGKAYQNFMAGIDLSNSKYADAELTTSSSTLRGWGQKEVTNGKADKAHLWIDNKPYTWKNVVDGNIPPPVSGNVTIPDMKDGTYKLEWWNTTTGVVDNSASLVKEATTVNSNLTIPVTNLPSDIALKISVTDIIVVKPDQPVTALAHPITYQQTYRISGAKSAGVTHVLVNGQEATLDNQNNTWTTDITLALGQNNITIIGTDDIGNQSDPLSIDLTRYKMGDVNDDKNIDLTDIAYIMANWGVPTNYLADFNNDNKTDLTDIAYIMANWGK